MSVLITGGTVVTHAGRWRADVLVREGTVVGLAAPGAHEWAADRTIDATGRYLLPGGVDVHTHMELPMGPTVSADDFETGTRAAAWGGTTTIVDFAAQARGGSLVEGLERRLEQAVGRCAVDYGLHMSVADVNDGSLDEMAAIVESGVTTFKVFMAYPGVVFSDDGQIFRVMQTAAELGAMVMVHAENGLVIDVLRRQAVERGETDPIVHTLTRPPLTEAEATHRAVVLAELSGCPLYVVHMSAMQAVEEVAAARRRAVDVFGETCPQYLFLDWTHLASSEGAKYVASTPLRNREEGHQEALWTALAGGDLQVVSTDHCPFCMGDHPTLGPQKSLGSHDFTAIPNGVPGVEERMRLLFSAAVAEGRMSLERMVEVCCADPAKIFGLYPRKGTIAVGSDADIVIWDPDAEDVITVDTNHMNVDYTAYEGREVTGRIETVLLRGEPIVADGAYVGRPGDGRFLPRGRNQLLR
ncbi:MAG TPA: dihydropyrimidinase [Acidimicrobiia bacterium]|nr:dihydropyrimidinase [Acidimicrobiia bacterium]